MNRPIRKRKCRHCRGFFVPDYRNVGRQRYCSKPPCKQASKADSQRRWLQKPENHDHFRGPDNVKRVQLWRQEHPGYWRRPTPKASETSDALQETCTPQEVPTQSLSENLETPPQDALQDSFFLQPAVFAGGNITGVASLVRNLGPKRLQVFRDMIPSLKRVLLPYDATDAGIVAEVKTYRKAARHLGIELLERPVWTQAEAQTLLTQVRKRDVDGIFQTRCCGFNIPGFILDAISQQGISAIFDAAFWVERGALASYGGDYYASGKQSARLLDKIIKGANPAEIPVEVNSKIEFAINLKTAKKLGLTIPPEVLFQANKLIR